jgi:hypothetical protein
MGVFKEVQKPVRMQSSVNGRRIMPKLLYFLPCDKLIVDSNGVVSLICILESIQVSPNNGVFLPPDGFAPREWDVVTQWEPESSDMGKTFIQRFALELPSGKLIAESKVTFKMEQSQHRNTVHILGFPLGEPGICKAKLWLDVEGEAQTVDPIAVYPLTVVHKKS